MNPCMVIHVCRWSIRVLIITLPEDSSDTPRLESQALSSFTVHINMHYSVTTKIGRFHCLVTVEIVILHGD